MTGRPEAVPEPAVEAVEPVEGAPPTHAKGRELSEGWGAKDGHVGERKGRP